jgi:CRP-like cAMP-binding protein
MGKTVAAWSANVLRVAPWASVVHGRGYANRTRALAASDAWPGRTSADESMPTAAPSPRQNHLLAALPAADLERLAPYLQSVEVRQGDVICQSGRPSRGAYFPTTSLISLQCVTQAGASAEVAAVGREGLVGEWLAPGTDAVGGSAVVQAAGHAYRLPVHQLQRELNHGSALAHLLLRYAQSLISQLTQIAVCNRHHAIEQQLSRWLLLATERVPSGSLSVTQEMVARLLGVRREGVTQAAGRLQQAGFIRYRRGRVSVLDRAGLELRSCECYGAIRSELERLATGSPSGHPCTALARTGT